jgi:outer membrane protein OmpA-like peptidoglycan-associated protein
VEKELPKNSTAEQWTLLGNSFSGYSTFRTRAFQEAIQEVGLNVHYENEFDITKLVNRFNQKQADLALMTLDQFLKQKPQGKIIGLVDTTLGADAVVLNTKKYPNLKSLVDLTQLVQQAHHKQQRLQMTFAGDTSSEYLALVLNSKFDAFKLSDFQINQVSDASRAWNQLQDPNQDIALAVLWEPYVTQARRNGYTVILSSADVPQTIVNVIVASNHLIESQSNKISKFLEAYYRYIDLSRHNASQLQTQIALDGNLSTNDSVTVLKGINFFTSIEAQDWMNRGILAKQIRSTGTVLKLADKLKEVPPHPQDLYNVGLIAKAAKNTQNLIDLVNVDNPELAKKLESAPEALTSPSVNLNQIQTVTDIGNLQIHGQVKFATDSDQITSESKQTLSKLAQQITDFNSKTVAVRIIGHTSQFGDAEFNRTLSQQRAQSVANYLHALGIKHKLLVVGKGSSQPLPDLDPQDKRNQRTEIRLVRLN